MKRVLACICVFVLAFLGRVASAAPATLLFEDDFDRGIPGWTAVQPPGNYIDGPMRWQYEIVAGAFVENSNIYTDLAAASASATAVMLINETVAPAVFNYEARLIAGDDDGFGLIFGYKDPTNFFRVTFARQAGRTGFPYTGWNVDRKVNNVATNLFGAGAPDFVPSFVNVNNRPFDVRITVNSEGLFSLTVVDDPDATIDGPIEYKLVENQPLPAAADGKVGIFTWGQNGNTPRAFQIKDLILGPTPLTGNPNGLLNWTAGSTVRADGVTTYPAGRWYLPVGTTGAQGVLVEDSDAAPANDASGNVDFPSATLVAGDTTWSNYVVRARALPTDDDGYGLLLRYVNSNTFYRVAIRGQNVQTGIRRGLSVQKAVDGVFEDVFFETGAQYVFPNNVPFEISAAIITNQLQILVRGNLNSTPTTYSYGPFDLAAEPLTTNTIPAGKFGFMAWAINRIEWDWVKVYAVEGTPLDVTSAFGPTDPPVGVNSYAPGSAISASAPATIEDAPGRRRRVTGFTGFGSVPSSGSGNSVTFTLDQISSIAWDWVTEYRLNLTAGSGGTISAPPGEWQLEGTTPAVTALPNAGYLFTGWSGTTASVSPTLNLNMVQAFTLTATFKADSDNDGLPDEWETLHFTALTQGAEADPDEDGFSNLAEYKRGTNPKFEETELMANPRPTPWQNAEHDPALPGMLVVRDYGTGFRGLWENSNDYQEATTNPFLPASQRIANISFEGPRIILKTNIWNPAWTNFTGSAVFSVADNDGNCLYFRYQSESNWYRATFNGSDAFATWRAPQGISVQKRVNGIYTQIAEPDPSIWPDPTDANFYKRFRVTVIATNDPNYEVRVAGWNTRVDPPGWDPEIVLQFSDPDLSGGRFGVGTWGQSGLANALSGATTFNPVDAGALIDDVVVEVDGAKVFEETWDTAPLAAELPGGWSDPTGSGVWVQSGHGSVIQTSSYGPATTGTLLQPKADAESANFVNISFSGDYFLEMGFHPFDSDGIGFVYDFVDPNNYSRVLFVSAPSADGRMPRGVNVSRKVSGVWSDILVGDPGFIYTAGIPFTVEFARNALEYRLNVWNAESATPVAWTWPVHAGAPIAGSIGFATWAEADAHFDYVRVSEIESSSTQDLSISGFSVAGGNLVLTISNPAGGGVNVEASSTLAPNSWTAMASNVTTPTWSVAIPPGAGQTFYRLSK